MSTVTSPPAAPVDRELWAPSAGALRWVVGVLAAVGVAVRLTYISRNFGTDEAGYLVIAQQWTGHGSSLYTDQWVDRPPLLLVMFQLGDLMGGLTGVRILGAILAAVIIIGTAVAAHLLAGRRAALVAAVVMTAWTVTPAFASITVNGEYLAAPFVVWGIAATLAALRATSQRRALVLGFLAGAAGFAAMLVKQNHADALLFGLLACLFAGPMFGTAPARAAKVFASAAVGGVAIIGATALLCVVRGTSVTGVYEAMFPFRFEADDVKSAAGLPPFLDRFSNFGHVWLVSGVLIVTVVALVVGLFNRKHRVAVLVLAVLLVFVHVSVASGINFFAHYMVQLLVPVALLAGVAATRSRLFVPGAVALAVAAAVLVTPGSMFTKAPGAMSKVGEAMSTVGEPGDSITVLYGRPGVVFGSGMEPAYENLFTLPLRVRDPKLTELNKVMTSDDPPTWIVKWGPTDRWGLRTAVVKKALVEDYTKVTSLCGHSVYLLDSADRDVPQDPCTP